MFFYYRNFLIFYDNYLLKHGLVKSKHVEWLNFYNLLHIYGNLCYLFHKQFFIYLTFMFILIFYTTSIDYQVLNIILSNSLNCNNFLCWDLSKGHIIFVIICRVITLNLMNKKTSISYVKRKGNNLSVVSYTHMMWWILTLV
jgi:hypothetical protein